MNKNVVITGAGQDRVGIVADLSEFLYKCGCNLLDSSMTLLRGEFALIVMAALPEGLSIDDLRSRLAEFGQKWHLMLNVRECNVDMFKEEEAHHSYIIAVYCADRSGIVAGITRQLASMRLNITDVATKFSGTADKSIFVMMLEVSSDEPRDAQQLQEQLAAECGIPEVDISVQELDTVEL